MFVKEKSREFSTRVLAMYWVDGERYHLVIPYEGYNGLVVITEKECEITDNRIDDMIIIRLSQGRDVLINTIIDNNDIYAEMVDHQPDAMAQFLTLCKESNIDIFRDYSAYRPTEEVHGTEYCPCCDNKSLNSSACYEKCSICNWIDDPIQSDDPYYRGGENEECLNSAREMFRKAGRD